MFEVGECFDLNGTTLEIKEIFTQPKGELMYKIDCIDRTKYTREKGIISETILKKISSFPF